VRKRKGLKRRLRLKPVNFPLTFLVLRVPDHV
jgi:hypothetical protein